MVSHADLVQFIRAQLLARNLVSAEYIPRHCDALAAVCKEMAERFLRGGRLLAFGVGPYLTDAQHVSVEFVHPVIVGKRALAALDLSAAPEEWLAAILRPDDIVMGFGPPEGNARVHGWLDVCRRRGALVCEWPGRLGAHDLPAASSDPFIHQELTELMYHTLWETVHVFLEQQTIGHDVGASAFLYPFLGEGEKPPADTLSEVALSIQHKAADDERLRSLVAAEQSEPLAAAALAIHERLIRGGTILAFGNGGSATDANDFVLDCVVPPAGIAPLPAVSLSMEPANISAIANDVGVELVFMRQMIAGGRPQDIAFGISTSGKSKNVIAALVEARKRGMLTLALLGSQGGDILRDHLADHAFTVPSDYIPRLQEVQAAMYHTLRLALGRLKGD
ncbi:MAG TPA: SIS domain-containing protein [Pirellulales bacterium]|jgi:D-sedoheptulose 7-phosphate isomerase|nr:SIS domain-containing protein [Pirellulales bacterium]